MLLTIAALGCDGCSDGGGMYATVTVKDKELTVEWHRADPGRRYPAVEHAPLGDQRGVLVGWPYDRIQHYSSQGSGGGFEVLFLASDGRIVERQHLKANSDEGVTSKVEARYALLVAEGWLARMNVSESDRVAFSGGITGNAPEAMPEIKVGGVPLRVEVAASGPEQTRGLMHRRAMSAEDGMVFLYPSEKERAFWMGNCHYPIDIAYFDAAGKFINVVPMEPYPDPKVDTGKRAPSERPAQYIVETHKGWFKAKGLVDAEGKATRDFVLEMPASVRSYKGK